MGAPTVFDNPSRPDCDAAAQSSLLHLLGNQAAGGAAEIRVWASLMTVTLPPQTAWVLGPDVAPPGGYTNYKRVQ